MDIFVIMLFWQILFFIIFYFFIVNAMFTVSALVFLFFFFFWKCNIFWYVYCAILHLSASMWNMLICMSQEFLQLLNGYFILHLQKLFKYMYRPISWSWTSFICVNIIVITFILCMPLTCNKYCLNIGCLFYFCTALYNMCYNFMNF